MLPSTYRVIVLAADDIQALHEELVAKDIYFELPPIEYRGAARDGSDVPRP
jgi:hypothetical protein